MFVFTDLHVPGGSTPKSNVTTPTLTPRSRLSGSKVESPSVTLEKRNAKGETQLQVAVIKVYDLVFTPILYNFKIYLCKCKMKACELDDT